MARMRTHAARLAGCLILGALAAACGGGGGSTSSPTTGAPAPSPSAAANLGPPNVVVILADDLGWGDLGVYGGTAAKTPNIDRMAADGARFTSFYVDAPICAPSRAAIMTGRWPPAVGIPWNPPDHLDPDEYVIAQPLHDRGYATGMVGKWHLGWVPEDMPIHYGFDYYYGVAAGEDEGSFVLGDQPTKDVVNPDQYAFRYTDYALKYIKSLGPDRRFFFYLAHRDPHLPNYPAAGYAGTSPGGSYGDTIQQLDAAVGQFLQGLKDLGLDQNTLVIFTSDNGPAVPPKGPGSTGGLAGGKGSCEEGGIRVPAIMRWPARIKAGRVVDEPVTTLDLFPTIVALTGASMPPRHYHGEDVSRLITGEIDRIPGKGTDGGREIVFWQEGGKPGALRSGKYKYLRPGFWNTAPTLFDLSVDPREQANLAPSRPELVKQLETRLQEILASN